MAMFIAEWYINQWCSASLSSAKHTLVKPLNVLHVYPDKEKERWLRWK